MHNTYTFLMILCMQKADAWDQPLTDQFAKEGRDKKVTFTCRFNKAITGEAKWSFKQDVSSKRVVYARKIVIAQKILTSYYHFLR